MIFLRSLFILITLLSTTVFTQVNTSNNLTVIAPEDPNFLYDNKYIQDMSRDDSMNAISISRSGESLNTDSQKSITGIVTDDKDLYTNEDGKEIKKPLVPMSQIYFFIFVLVVFMFYRYKMKK